MTGKPWFSMIVFWSLLSVFPSLAQAALSSQIGVFRPQTGQWYLDLSGDHAWNRCGPDGCLLPFGAPGDRPLIGDWSGNGVPKIGVFRPADGYWYLDLNGNNFWDGCSMDGCLGPFGAPEDRPVLGDWTGSGVVRFGVFRPSTGYWYRDLNGNGQWDGCGLDGCSGPFGAPDDQPVVGDIDADGVLEFGVFRAGTGMWYFDRNSNGSWDGCDTDDCLGPFGMTGDQAVLDDMNGDGTLDMGVFRPGTSQWYFDLDHNGAWSGCGADGCFGSFGGTGDLPVTGVWDRTAGPGDPMSYFPITQSNTWTFQGVSYENGIYAGSYQNTVAVTGTRVIDGVTTSVVSMSNPGNTGPIDEYLLKDGRGITNWGNNDPADTITPLVAAYQELIFPPWSGETFKQFELNGVDFGEDFDGDWINERGNVSSQVTIAGFENLSVAAGSFSDCVKVISVLTLSGPFSGLPGQSFSASATTTTWYAPGVGPVKVDSSLLVTTSFGASVGSANTETLTSYAIVPSQVLGTPTQLGTGEGPRLAVSPNGDAFCVWSQQDSIWASRYLSGAGWDTPAPAENHSGLARTPRVAVDSSGNAMAAWIELSDLSYDLWVNRFVPGSGWGTPQLIDNNPGPNASPAIAADPSGNVTLVWRKNEGGTQSVWVNRFEPGSGWGASARIEPAGGWAESPRLAVDAAGNAIVVWYEQAVGIIYNVFASRYVSGVGWGAPELIEGNVGAPTIDALAIDMNPTGTAVVVWPQGDGSYVSVWSNRYVPGAGWGTAVRVENGPYDTHATDVAITQDGSSIAVWLQSDGTYQHIWANRYVSGSGWEAPTMLESFPGNAGADVQVAIDPNGVATATWTQVDGSEWTLWANSYVPGSGWSTPQRLEANVGIVYGPQVAVDTVGNVFVAWYQWLVSEWTVWANRFQP